jgi:phage shock protein A
MGIFDRMGKVIQSNLNALLERAEDDRKLVELNLDEMDEQVRAGQQEVVQALGAEKQLQKRCDDLLAEVEKWNRRAELALRSGDEALAREALRQKRRVAADLEGAQRARDEQRDIAAKMKSDLERMKEKIASLRIRKPTLVARSSQARAGAGAESLGSRGGPSAFDNFKRMEEKIEGGEAQSQAMAEVEDALGKGPRAEELEAKFRDLERQSGGTAGAGDGNVEDELAALKKRIRI